MWLVDVGSCLAQAIFLKVALLQRLGLFDFVVLMLQDATQDLAVHRGSR